MTTSLRRRTAAVGALVLFNALCTPALCHPGRINARGCHQHATARTEHCHSERSTKAVPFDPVHAPRPGDEGVFHGPLVRVADGDTLTAKVQGVVMEFRLAQIDAPELRQPYGEAAKRELYSLVAGKYLVIMPLDTDRYGRTVAHVWAGQLQVNQELLRRGAAWFYAAYSRGAALDRIEQQARQERRGLWSLPRRDRVEPWLWRRESREAARGVNREKAPPLQGSQGRVKGHPL